MRFSADHWALILGGSSGFGLAAAKKLAACGMSVAVVHRDRRGAMGPIAVVLVAPLRVVEYEYTGVSIVSTVFVDLQR